MTIYVGVDPGFDGAIAVIFPDGVSYNHPMPVMKGKKTSYDLSSIRDMFTTLRSKLKVTVEIAGPIPPRIKAGSLAQYHRGVNEGWLWLFAALNIKHQAVKPRAWQRVMHAGVGGPLDDTKRKSIIAAQRLFPEVSLLRTPRCSVPHDGIADALLLAEYARRTM